MRRALCILVCVSAVLAGGVRAGGAEPQIDKDWIRRKATEAAGGRKETGHQSDQPTTSGRPPVPIAWRNHLEEAIREAAERSRCVLVFFRADWCRPCSLMEKGTFTIPAIAQFINQAFVPVRVDDSEQTSSVSQKYAIRVYPSVLFLDPAGKPLHLVLGPRQPEPFYGILKQVQALPGLMERQAGHRDSVKANFDLGFALAKLGHMERGAPYLERAAQLDPKNEKGIASQARLLLAVVPLERGRAQEALDNIEAYLKEFPDAPEVPVAIWYQGTILYQDNRLPEARRYFEAILQRFPKHPKAYEADKAIAHIDKILKAREEGSKLAPKPPTSEPAPGSTSGVPRPAPTSPVPPLPDDQPQPKG